MKIKLNQTSKKFTLSPDQATLGDRRTDRKTDRRTVSLTSADVDTQAEAQIQRRTDAIKRIVGLCCASAQLPGSCPSVDYSLTVNKRLLSNQLFYFKPRDPGGHKEG